MLTSAVISFLVGVVLSRSKVLVVLPALFLTAVIALGVAMARPEAVWSTAATAAVIIVGLQMGYLLGIVMREVAHRVRDRRPRSTSVTS